MHNIICKNEGDSNMKFGMVFSAAIFGFSVLCAASANAQETDLGGTKVGWSLFSRPDEVHLMRFNDPNYPVTCYLTRSISGGFMPQSWSVSNADFSISCVQKKHTHIDTSTIPANQTLFDGNDRWWQRFMSITRIYDKDENKIIYMTTPSMTMKERDMDHSSLSVIDPD